MIKNTWNLIFFIGLFLTNCVNETSQKLHSNSISITENNKVDSVFKEVKLDTINEIKIEKTTTPICDWDTYLENESLVNIQALDSSIMVELKYSTEDNFMKKDMYGCLENCYLQPDVAEKLINAQQFLKEINPRLSLLVYDGLRPRSIQQYMWDILDLPLNEKVKFVSNPKRGSLHNFGAAVDITIYNLDSLKPLDMGAPYDFIGVKAWPTKEKLMLEKGIITQQHIDNRKLLRKVMTKAKFFNIQTEWWHFNSCYRNKAYEIYHIIEGFPVKI